MAFGQRLPYPVREELDTENSTNMFQHLTNQLFTDILKRKNIDHKSAVLLYKELELHLQNCVDRAVNPIPPFNGHTDLSLSVKSQNQSLDALTPEAVYDY